MMNYGRGILSEDYFDIDTGERIKTFSYPISRSIYLFLDMIGDFGGNDENR